MSFRLSTGIVAISRFAQHEGESLYHRNVFSVIYHGSTALDAQSKRPHQLPVELISVSRLTPYKGFHIIIEALNKISTKIPWRLTIVGSQPKEAYVTYLKNIGRKNIRIVSNISDSKLARLYADSDIYVSADRYLYFGLPIMEAAYFGLPAVVYNYAAAREIVAHQKTGYVASNEIQLSDYLKKLIEQPTLRKKSGTAAQKRVRHFSWEVCAKKWEDVLIHFSKTKNLN